MTNLIKNCIGIAVIIILLYMVGFIKLPKNWQEIKEGKINVLDPCFRKNVSGKYKLALLFEQSKNTRYQKLKMEILYSFDITQQRCELSGKGEKIGFSTIDTITGKRGLLNLDKKIIKVNGLIKEDTLFLNLTFDTPSTNDYQVNIGFPFNTENITVLYSRFKEQAAMSEGSAKITKEK